MSTARVQASRAAPTAATVTQRYVLDLADRPTIEPEATVTLRPKGGLPLRLHRRPDTP